MARNTSQQPLGGIKVYVDYQEDFGHVAVQGVTVAGHAIPLGCFSPAQLELWRVDIQIEVECEELDAVEMMAELHSLEEF